MGYEYKIHCATQDLRLEDFDFSNDAHQWKVASNDGEKVRFSFRDSNASGWDDAILIRESSFLYLLINIGHIQELVNSIEDFLRRREIGEFLTEEI